MENGRKQIPAGIVSIYSKCHTKAKQHRPSEMIICDWGWSQSMKMDGFEKLEIDPIQKILLKKFFLLLATNSSREFHIAI